MDRRPRRARILCHPTVMASRFPDQWEPTGNPWCGTAESVRVSVIESGNYRAPWCASLLINEARLEWIDIEL
jgi:hypothetical protein